MTGIEVPYFALITARSLLASSLWVAAPGCTASHENASPNGFAEQAAPNDGKGATCVGIARSESSVGLGLNHAHARCTACVESKALYASTVVTSFFSSAGWIVWGSVQLSVVGDPAWAAAISGPAKGKETSTESPFPPRLLGAQFGPTVKAAGRGEGDMFLSAKYVWPAVKNGIPVTFATPMTTAPFGLTAAIESSTRTVRVWKLATAVIFVLSPPLAASVAAPRTSLLPSQTVTNVGRARCIICVWVSPPRKNVVSALAFDAVSRLEIASITSAPGTATLLMNGGGGVWMFRSAQGIVLAR